MDKILNELYSFSLTVHEDSQNIAYIFGYDDVSFGYIVKNTQTVRIHYREHGKPAIVESYFFDSKKFKTSMKKLTKAYNSNKRYEKYLKIKEIGKNEF